MWERVLYSPYHRSEWTTYNYTGTTVQCARGYLTYNDQKYEVIDVPGTYQLNPEAELEKVVADKVTGFIHSPFFQFSGHIGFALPSIQTGYYSR